MKTVMMFIAGTMFLSTGYSNDAASAAAKIAAKEAPSKEIMNCARHDYSTQPAVQTTVGKSAVTSGDPFAEERFRMKYGRYTPREETRTEAVKIAANAARAEQVPYCAMHGCCTSNKERAAVTKSETGSGDPGAEARFRMKYGRNSPAGEGRVAAAKRAAKETVLAASAQRCEGDCCN